MIIQKNVLLKNYSNYKIGGPAAYFLEAKSTEELKEGLKEWKNINLDSKPIFILGGGTNILFGDNGYSGLVIHCEIKGIKLEEEKIKVGAGVLISELLDFCIENSLSGFEWAGGLPGTIGGALRGNAGAFGGETKDTTVEVKSLNTDTLEELTRNNTDCLFGYRDSYFKTDKGSREIITEITLVLKNKDREEIRKKIFEKINYRREHHPLEYPNIGSIFKNLELTKIPDLSKEELGQNVKTDPIPVIPAARIINLCGLKGKRAGDAQFSEKHPNFIVNLGNAKASDVKALIEIAKKEVFEKFQIQLEEEVMEVGSL